MNRYFLYSTGLHLLGLGISLVLLLRTPPPPRYFGIDFLGGGSGSGMGGPAAAPADRPTPPIQTKPDEETLPEEKPSVNDKNRLLLKKKEEAKKPAKQADTVAKKIKTPAKAGGDVYNKKKGVLGGTGDGLALEVSGTGGGGGFGKGGGSASMSGPRFPFAWYINLIYKKLWDNWDNSNAGDSACTVGFVIHRDGSLSGVKVLESSGDGLFDQLAERAVEVSEPFPPLPEGYAEPKLPVYVKFTLE